MNRQIIVKIDLLIDTIDFEYMHKSRTQLRGLWKIKVFNEKNGQTRLHKNV